MGHLAFAWKSLQLQSHRVCSSFLLCDGDVKHSCVEAVKESVVPRNSVVAQDASTLECTAPLRQCEKVVGTITWKLCSY